MKWTDTLANEVYIRLCNCKSRKADILPLAQARWAFIKNKQNFEKEDALIYVLELLGDNDCDCDLTEVEYEDILSSIL